MLDGGRVRAAGRPEEVLTAEMVREVYGAKVIMERNPVSGKPHVVVTAGGGEGEK